MGENFEYGRKYKNAGVTRQMSFELEHLFL